MKEEGRCRLGMLRMPGIARSLSLSLGWARHNLELILTTPLPEEPSTSSPSSSSFFSS